MNKFLCAVCFIMFCFSLSNAFEIDVKFYRFSGTYDNDEQVSSLTWSLNSDTIEYHKQTAQWRVSDVYMLIKSTCTDSANEKVYIYQDNANNDAPYSATTARDGWNGDEFSGLVKANSGGGNLGYAPIKYRIYRKGADDLPIEIPTDFYPDGYYGARWLKDKSDYDFGTDSFKTYTQIVSDKGIWVGNGVYGEYFEKYDMVVFFGAYFTDIQGGDSYGTTTINFVFEYEE